MTTATLTAPEPKAGVQVATAGIPKEAILTVPGETFDLSFEDTVRIGRPVLVMLHLLPHDHQLRRLVRSGDIPPRCIHRIPAGELFAIGLDRQLYRSGAVSGRRPGQGDVT
jgi:hypothetical protein